MLSTPKKKVCLRKKKGGGDTRAPVESLAPLIANQDLIALLASPMTVTFNWPFQNYQVSTSEVIYLIGSQPSSGEGNLAEQPHSLLETSFFYPLLPIKAFHLVQLLGAPFYPLDGTLSSS